MKSIIFIAILSLLVGGIIGYTIALHAILNFAVTKGVAYLEFQGINVSIDKSLIAQDLWRYKNRISECP